MILPPGPGQAGGGSWVEGQPVDLVEVVGDARYADAWALAGGRRGPSARARRRQDSVEVVVKVAATPAPRPLRKSFLADAARRQDLCSPELVPVLDAGLAGDGRPWLATPWYLEGSFGAPGQAVTVDGVLAAARQVAAGLAVFHAVGLVHGNVTPPNVLIAGPGRVALAGSSLPGLSPRRAQDEVADHVPPEVVEGHEWDDRSDVWALGSCVHAWLGGRVPWAEAAGKGVVPWLLAVSTEPPSRARRADVPAWLQALVVECLSGDPQARPAASDLAERLQSSSAPLRSVTVAPRPLAGGRPLGSRYLLLEPIGAGAVGQVWRGQRRSDGAAVAVKVLRPELTSSPEAVARFVRERTTLVGLEHPNVVSVLDLVAEGETLAIVMELVDGRDLRTVLTDCGPLDPRGACGLLAQVAAGVASMHQAGLVHRDIKPENVLVQTTSAGAVARVTDFGLARALDGPSVTRTEQLVGTAEYLAPELVAGRPLTPRADVYSLGVLLYEIVSGHRPFEGEHPAAVLRSHLDENPDRPPGLPDPVWDLVVRMMAKDPASRPAAAEVADQAARLAGGAVGPAPTPAAPPVAGALVGFAAEPASPAPRDGETSAALAALRLEPAPEPPTPTPTRRGTRWYLTAAGLAVVALGAAGAGISFALNHSQGAPIRTQNIDVTTAVTLGAGGTVTITWPAISAPQLDLVLVTVQPAIPGRTSPLTVVSEPSTTDYQVTGIPPGLHCFSAVAAFNGKPPAGIPRAIPSTKECVTVP